MTRPSSKSLPALPTAAIHASTSSDAVPIDHTGTTRRSCVTNNCIRTTVTLLVFAAYVAWTWPWHLEHWADATRGRLALDTETARHRTPPLGVPKALQTSWAQYSPWHPLDEYSAPPAGCEINQVHILQRHGARYPNSDDGELYSRAVEHISSAEKFSDKRLKFLEDYEYELGADDLVPFGAAQSFESGEIAFKRYANLVSPTEIPYVRAAGAPRVISTATNWTVGFAAASHQRYQPYLNTIISEEYNNTLNQDCPNAEDGSREIGIWLSIFGPPIAARLNKAAPGAKLNETHVFHLLAMCPFESVAKETMSPFCAMFKEEDFHAFEYYGDLEKYYKTGHGNPLGAIQGVGYVNELLARLTDEPVQDHTTHNSSLEFPLGKKIYADFTHENLMVAVYAALGLFNVSEPLDPRNMPEDAFSAEDASRWNAPFAHMKEREARTWVASRMVPFSSRMVTERMTCVRDGKEDKYVRILVNDEVQPLEFCGAGEDRMCKLDDFVRSQGYARRSGDGDFEKCYN
ncbi:acid phosphatase [Lentinus tigrinus ALCF2SS1-7]|uniref:Phytase A n=1 Tax=Lentinus tigrinus ALCF2SS1-6 TaxID=1328759 RepID=A0A5C2S090_9APHY|nr:acid phosphatase [Lentinus tigrinus ALCF2SS1-6]RPD71572.1 acid phosphatase [Lentinus tigrinus ALCF2SS1-7]